MLRFSVGPSTLGFDHTQSMTFTYAPIANLTDNPIKILTTSLLLPYTGSYQVFKYQLLSSGSEVLNVSVSCTTYDQNVTYTITSALPSYLSFTSQSLYF